MFFATRFLLAAFCTVSLEAHARTFNFAQLIQKSVEVSPELKSSQANRNSAEESFKEARSSFFPSIDLTATYANQVNATSLTGGTDFQPNDETYSAALTFEQPIFLGGQIWAGYHIRKLSSKIADAQDFIARQAYVLQTVATALALESQRQLTQTLVQGQKTQKEFLDVTRRRARRGGVQDFELDQARANYLSYAPRIDESKRIEQDNERKLELMLGLEEKSGVKVDLGNPAKDPALKVALPNSLAELKPYLKQAFDKRMEVKAAELAVRLSRQEKKLDVGTDLPQLAVAGSYGYQNPSTDDFTNDQAKATSLSVSLTIPLFSGLSSIYKRRAGSQKIAAKEYDLEALKRDLKQEVHDVWREFSSVSRRYEQSSRWRDSAERALRKGRSKYRLGAISQTQFIQLQTAWEQAQTNFIAQKQLYYLSFVQWHRILGVPLEGLFK